MAEDDPRVKDLSGSKRGAGRRKSSARAAQDRIDAALRESEQRYRNLISASNQVLYRHNADWSEMRQLSGGGFLADTEEPDPNWFEKYIHPDDQEHVWAAIQEAIRTKSLFELEHRVIRDDGTLGWTLSRSVPILDENGEIVEWFGAASDTTARNEAEERLRQSVEQLRESEHRLRLAAEAADVGTWDFNPDTGELRWDERCKRFFGLPADAEVTYEIFLSGLHPDDRARTDAAVQGALEPNGPGEYEVEYRTVGIEDQVERWIAAKGRAIFEGEGAAKHAVRFIGTVIDISDRRRAADELKEESHNLEILNRTGAAIASELGLERVVQLVTDAGVELIGAEFGAFFYNVVDDKGESYTLYTLSGVDRSAFEKFPMPRNTHVFGPTFRGEGVVRSDDITKDPRYGKNPPYYGKPKGHLPVVSYLAVSVVSRTGEVVGGLFFGHSQPGRFKQRHERLMEGIAAQAAIAIDNARLYGAAQHEIEQRVSTEQTLTTLNRAGSALAAELDLDRLVQLITDAATELCGAAYGAFFYNVTSDTGEKFMLYTLTGADMERFEKIGMPRVTKLFEPTFTGTEIVRCDDVTKDPRYGQNPPFYGRPEGHLDIVSYLAVPVISRNGEVLGGLFFGHPEAGRFTERHAELITGIAGQAATAMDNAKLYRDAQSEIEQRMKAEQALTALNETLESRVAEEIARRSQAEEVLRQSQKMETVGQLSGGIAHDFNNLLQVVHGNLTLIHGALPEGEEKLRRAAANALSGSERAAALTKRLLAFSRRQPLDPRPIDVNRLIADMTEMLHRTLGETIVIETEADRDLPPALVDANQLENAILNLAINARDAMPNGGRLSISTGVADVDDNYSSSNPDAAPGQYVCIRVRDDGEGMSSEVMNRAIEPFFSTKEVGQGTGLGLSTVYGFVRQSGGHLLLESREGRGTCVQLYLPRAEARIVTAAATSETGAPLAPGRGERVLLCEDDEGVRLFSSETLRDLGYEVIEAGDASSALSSLLDSGRIDLLFTDVVLPGGKTGADLAREARKLQPDLKVLFTTGYARSALDRDQTGEKGIELLLKPFGVDELAAKVREMLG